MLSGVLNNSNVDGLKWQTILTMNTSVLRILLSLAASVAAYKVITVKPIRNYILMGLLNGAIFLVKRKLR